jgi:hypothetical protein
MMNYIMECGVYNIPTTLNEYNEVVEQPPVLAATIEMAIGILTGSTITSNNVKTINSTHLGITDYRGLNENQQIVQGTDTYAIDFINDAGRKVLVYLKQVQAK